MKMFIDQLAEYLIKENADLSKTIVIFPNRRPALFLNRALGKLSNKPIFAPQTFSIRDFIYKHSDFAQTDNITLLFKLYDVYRHVNLPENTYAFEQFISSGELMIADFNDIDNYLVNPGQLFSNLDQAKAIELWNPGKDSLTETELRYLEFFQNLQKYYTTFKNNLTQLGIAYDGMAYRQLAESIELGRSYVRPESTYLFCGFNALNKAEKLIINHFLNKGKGKIFWDADEAFVFDKNQEAGVFLRKNLETWPSQQKLWIGSDLFSSKKNITITGAPLSLSQIKYSGQILNEIFNTDPVEINQTVVVPADETTLESVLESIPDEIEHINVTMGYNYQESLIFQFLSLFIRLHVRSFRFNPEARMLRMFYEDIINFVKHPLFQLCRSHELPFSSDVLIGRILKLNKLFYSTEELQELLKEIPELQDEHISEFIKMFSFAGTSGKLTQQCLKICASVEENIPENDKVLQVMLSASKQVLSKLEEYSQQAGFDMNVSLFELLFKRLTTNLKIPFEGEPLGGLQIMGFLETRCLDFKNVILLNFNEGFIPPGSKRMQTFIPFDLRRSYEMPLPSNKDAMYAYYFLRLLQRAENVWILYNTEPDILSGKEVSRFVRQIEYEFKHKADKNWKVTHNILQIPFQPSASGAQHSGAEKTPQVMNILEDRISRGYSASRLFNYFECPFRFYLKYVLGIEEPTTEVSGSIEMNTLGTVVHETLKELYTSGLNIKLDDKFFGQSLHNYQTLLDQQFALHYPGGDMTSGKNLIIHEVAKKMVQNVLISDKRIAEKHELIPLYVENEVSASLTVNNRVFPLFGKFDRVDRLDGIVRVADYKTGKVDSLKILKKASSEQNEVDFYNFSDKQFQLMFYLLLSSGLKEISNSDLMPQAGIISLKMSNVEFKVLEMSDKEKEIPTDFLEKFGQFVGELIAEIHNPHIPFVRTEDTEKCKFCVYNSICNYFSPILTDDTNDE